MTPTTYNAALLCGLLMIGAGMACWSIPAALVTVGSLVIVLTFATLRLAMRRGGN